MPRSRLVSPGFAALGCVVAIAACGGTASDSNISGSSSPGSSSGNNSGFLKFALCMRANGVPNFPDPSGGGGIHISQGSGINPASPAFQAAQAKCAHLLPGGGPPKGPPSAQAKLAALKISECMRSHGISGFPDPTLSLPSNPADYGAVQDRGGVVLAIPKTINVASPAFQQAAAACGFG
jgi:hypothetical protein